jgi:hypothetical protein
MKAWLVYALVSGAVVVGVVLVASQLATGAALQAILFSAALAYVLQLGAFAGLVVVRERQSLFLAGWAGGIGLRFGALGIVAVWLSRSGMLPLEPALLTLAGVMFLLLLLEPIFLRWDLRAR